MKKASSLAASACKGLTQGEGLGDQGVGSGLGLGLGLRMVGG